MAKTKQAARPSTLSKPIFRTLSIATSGDFGSDRPPPKLKAWIEDKGGKYAGTKISSDVTHLVCSQANYDKGVAAVLEAEKLGIKLVTYDWLEDSLLEKKVKAVRGKYSAKSAWKVSKTEKGERKERERAGFKAVGPPDPESMAGLAGAFFGKHLKELESRDKTGDEGPVIEEFTLWNRVQSSGGEDGSKGGDEAMTDFDDKSSAAPPAHEDLNDAASSSLSSPAAGSVASPCSTPPKAPSVSKTEIERTSSSSPPIGGPSKSPSSTLSDLAAAIAAKKKYRRQTLATKKPPQDFLPLSTPPRLPAYITNPKTDIENHHLYRDTTGFTYDAKLIRIDLTKNTNERYFLRLYESHTKPSTYAVHLQYSSSSKKKGSSPLIREIALGDREGRVLAPVGSTWSEAWGVFRRVFGDITGVSWEERMEKAKAGLVRGAADVDGEVEKWFKYMMPKEGEPKGLMPPKGMVKL